MNDKNTDSLRTKLLIISKEKKISFQELLNRFGAEQFLARLSCSPYIDQFVFKGGSLLIYLIETDRKTRDLDFSIRRISNKVEDAVELIRKIISITLDDGLTWGDINQQPLNHPEMDHPGMRIKCPFRLGTARGVVRIDIAIGDVVEARKISLERIRYKDKPLVGIDFDLLVYPPETIFSEKLQIALLRKGNNTRMKDYYDLYKLSLSNVLDASLLKTSIENTFEKRGLVIQEKIVFADDIIDSLQTYWNGFIRKMELTDAPKLIKDVVDVLNQQLHKVYHDG